MILELALAFLTALLVFFIYAGKTWATTPANFLYANRSLKVLSSGLAITSHWFWAFAMFVAPAVAYNWGINGLLWFIIPNASSLLVMAWLTHRIRDKYPDGYSITEFIQDNFSKRISLLYQLLFAFISFAGVLLGFTAITKFFGFAGLGEIIDPIYASLVVGLITLAFTVRGGIRTSIYTGTIQAVLWIAFMAVMIAGLYNAGFDWNVLGKNNLETVTDIKFLTTFGIAYLASIFVGASSHGMMWQKSFSMPKENIWPSYIIGAIVFAAIVFSLGSLGLYAQSIGLAVKAPDLSSLAGITSLYGAAAITAFGVLLIGHTSTVMDSCMNYISSLISREWIKRDNTRVAQYIMIGFFLIAWIISWAKIEIWTMLMLVGAIRISMFIPLIFQVYQLKFRESIVFYASVMAVTGSLYLSWLARDLKNPIYDMYSVIYGLSLSLVACLVALAFSKKKTT